MKNNPTAAYPDLENYAIGFCYTSIYKLYKQSKENNKQFQIPTVNIMVFNIPPKRFYTKK